MTPKTWILLLPLVLLSSCFEFIEEITMKSEQSGTCQLTLNCSQSRAKLKGILSLDTFMGFNLPNEDQVREHFYRSEQVLSKCKGITKIENSGNFDQYIIKIKFDFDSIVHLNQALNAMAAIESKNNPLPFMTVYEFDNGTFKRLQIPDDSMLVSTGQRHIKLFEGATVTTIYRFNKTIDKVSNSQAVISKNKTAVMLKQKVTDLAKKPALLSNTILLK